MATQNITDHSQKIKNYQNTFNLLFTTCVIGDGVVLMTSVNDGYSDYVAEVLQRMGYM